MDDVHGHLVGRELQKRVAQRLDRTGHIAFDDQVEFLQALTLCHAPADLVERDATLLAQHLLTADLLTLLGDRPCFFFVGHDHELVADLGQFVETEHQHRNGGSGGLNAVAPLVEHRPHAATRHASHEGIAHAERPVLHQHGGHVAASFFHAAFDDGADGRAIRIRLQIVQLGLQQYLFEQIIDPLAGLGRNESALHLTAVLLDQHAVFGQLLENALRVGLGLVDLGNGHHDGHAGSFGVVDGLDRLRHHAIVGRHHQDHDVRHLGAASTHGREGFVPRRVQEGDVPTVRQLHMVGADVLRDAPGLAGHHVRLADVVQKRCLAVVDVPHHRNDGCPRLQIFRSILRDFYLQLVVVGDEFDFVAEFICHELDRVGVEPLVDGDDHPCIEERRDHFADLDPHQLGQLAHRDILRHPEFASFLRFSQRLPFSFLRMTFTPFTRRR